MSFPAVLLNHFPTITDSSQRSSRYCLYYFASVSPKKDLDQEKIESFRTIRFEISQERIYFSTLLGFIMYEEGNIDPIV
jgi:hypothetical protein